MSMAISQPKERGRAKPPEQHSNPHAKGEELAILPYQAGNIRASSGSAFSFTGCR